MDDSFEKFRQLLIDTYFFPASYTHKFIGKNSALFETGVRDLEAKFIGLKRVGERLSTSNGHLALTYEYLAGSAEDIIDLAKATYLIPDLIYIL